MPKRAYEPKEQTRQAKTDRQRKANDRTEHAAQRHSVDFWRNGDP